MRVDSDLSGVNEVSGRLRRLNFIASRAVTDAAKFTEEKSVRKISDHLNLRRVYVEGKIKTRRAPPSRPVAEVQAIDEPIQLRQFDPRQEFDGTRKAGVSFRILRGGNRVTIRRAFFAQARNSGLAIFMRTGPTRTPVKVLYGATPGQMFKLVTEDMTPEIKARVERDIYAFFGEAVTASTRREVFNR